MALLILIQNIHGIKKEALHEWLEEIAEEM
jgi:hypothetical protein